MDVAADRRHAPAMHPTRRSFLAAGSLAWLSRGAVRGQQGGAEPGLHDAFPTQPPDLVREVVGAAHGNVARLKALVDRQPALARAAWDWGFGDWESALAAASHVGHREIAEYLLANGARPNIFSAAMLGQLEVVRAFVAAQPGVQRTPGPHGITLFAHAVAGGEPARAVREYLARLGDADERPSFEPLTTTDRDRIAGTYEADDAGAGQFEVVPARDSVTFARAGGTPRPLRHLGALTFFPAGASAVRIRFAVEGGVVRLTVHDPGIVLTAWKRSAPAPAAPARR